MTLSIHYDSVEDIDCEELVNLICYKELFDTQVYVKNCELITIRPQLLGLDYFRTHLRLNRVGDYLKADLSCIQIYTVPVLEVKVLWDSPRFDLFYK